jgi:hypothetical protein
VGSCQFSNNHTAEIHVGSCQFFKQFFFFFFLISRMNIIGFGQREQNRVAGLVWYLQSFYWVDGSCQFYLFYFIFYLFL